MASKQLNQMVKLYASIKERASKPDLDLATIRDIVENLHLAATEPGAVTYAEVETDGVPALWCIPEGCDTDRVLLHSHAGGTVVTSMHTDRKAIGHIAKAVESAPRTELPAFPGTQVPPLKSMTWRRRITRSSPRIAGVDVSVRALREGQHNFLLGAGRVPEVDQSIEEIARWLRSRLGLAASAAA